MTTPQPSVTTTFRSSETPADPQAEEPRSYALDVAMRIAATTCYVASDVLTFVALRMNKLGDRIRSKIPGLRPWIPTGAVIPECGDA